MTRVLGLVLVAACGRANFAARPDSIAAAGALDAIADCGAALCPDTTFNGSGTLVVDVGGVDNIAFAYHGIAVQADDKLLLAGKTGTTGNSDMMIVRLLDDGSRDASFGTAGVVTIDTGGSDDEAISVRVTADQHIVVAGHGGGFGIVARLDALGTLDPSFGGSGLVRFSPPMSGGGVLNDVAVDADGTLVSGGQADFSVMNGGWNLTTTRLTAAGALDTAFDLTGYEITDLAGADEFGAFAAFGPSDTIMMIGQSDLGSGHDFDGVVARLLPGGGRDPMFGTNGVVATDYFGGADRYFALDTDAAGRWIAGGTAGNAGSQNDDNFAIARYLGDGANDPSFGSDGKVVITRGTGDIVRAIVQLPDGRIVAGGGRADATTPAVSNSVLMVLAEDGTLAEFDELNESAQNDEVNSAVLDNHGRLVVLGEADAGVANMYVLRLTIP